MPNWKNCGPRFLFKVSFVKSTYLIWLANIFCGFSINSHRRNWWPKINHWLELWSDFSSKYSFGILNMKAKKLSYPGSRIKSDIDRIQISPLRTNRIRIRIQIQPLRTNRIRIHAFFRDRIRIQTPLSCKFSIYFMMSFNKKLLPFSFFDGPWS